jgi:hypothetical protein
MNAAPVVHSASPDKGSTDQAALDQSWAIQRELAKIEKDPEAFGEALISSWVPYLDSAVYDPESELRPLIKAATPWRLYGASLVGDYRTMIDVLRGRTSAGRIINALSEPQPRMRPSAGPDLGETGVQLVFTPIAPCRIVDTRGTGARTGPMIAGVPRAFDLTTDGYTEGQGGATAGCPGLPSFSHLGWAINVTATSYSTIGGFTVYPFAGAAGISSIINYFPAAYAIANGSAVTGCYGCADDINLVSFGTNSHVIVDVMGYYEQATGSAGAVTQVAGTTTSVAAGGFVQVLGGACPAGTTLIGGTQTNGGGGANVVLTSDHSRSGSTWYEFVKNIGAVAINVTVSSLCQD